MKNIYRYSANKDNVKARNPILTLPIPKNAINWLVLSMTIAIGWHIQNTRWWAVAAAIIIIGLTYRLLIKDLPLPSVNIRVLLTIAAVGGILLSYKAYMGRDPGVTALILLSTLKLMELKTRRDFMISVFLCYFIVFSNFLYEQSMIDLVFTIIATVFITAALFRLNYTTPKTDKIKRGFYFRFSLRLILYGLPFTALLFLLFPRTGGPFLNLAGESLGIHQSGFNDNMQPGEIADMAISRAPAFQVEFPNNNMPSQSNLYFRGAVMWFTDGKRWYQGIMPGVYQRTRSLEGEGIITNITLYPHNERWLFTLDYPVAFQGRPRLLPGGIYQTTWTVKTHLRYSVLSRGEPYHSIQITDRIREWGLQIPDEHGKQIISLGRQWAFNTTNVRDIVRKAQLFFKQNGFVYTLHPGNMDSDEPYDDFMFNKRKGFCEHYAGAFTLAMRGAGIPSRVVLGYQGGQFNTVGNYLMVTQAEAHAWSEVWEEGTGWVRVDPTGWVSPERIQYGLDVSEALANSNLTGTDRENAIKDALSQNFLTKIWKFIKLHWDNINYKWDVWIISYDNFRQVDFFRGLGFDHINRGWLFLAVIIFIPLFFYAAYLLVKRQVQTPDPVLSQYYKFCLKMEKAGVKRFIWEGPVQFEERAIERFPEKREIISQITQLFIYLRYRQVTITSHHLSRLKRLIHKI